jgi:hypothetical protein
MLSLFPVALRNFSMVHILSASLICGTGFILFGLVGVAKISTHEKFANNTDITTFM